MGDKINLADILIQKQLGKGPNPPNFFKLTTIGAYGKVFKASYFGTDVAVKIIEQEDDDLDILQREVDLLKQVIKTETLVQQPNHIFNL
jgi:hypothetical protein